MNMPNGLLSPLQIAYVIGRSHYLPLGGVGMHDFRLFKGHLDGQRLKRCLALLVKKYEALRTLINAEAFTQTILSSGEAQYTEICLRDWPVAAARQEAERLIERHTHYVHDLKRPPWHFWLIQLPEGQAHEDRSILMISFDALILDGYAISTVLVELFEYYDDASLAAASTLANSHGMTGGMADIDFFANKPEDALFWHSKVQAMTQTIDFPWQRNLETIVCSEYKRATLRIDEQDWQGLSTMAAQQGLLPNALLNGMILSALAAQNNGGELYVAIPVSLSLYQQGLSNHSTVLAITFAAHEEALFFDTIAALQAQTFEALGHISFSGIEIARLICDQVKTSVPFPIVLTNGLSWPRPPRKEYLRYVCGQTQTPQVAMDVRASYSDTGDLLIDIDYAEEALSLAVIDGVLAAITALACQLLKAR